MTHKLLLMYHSMPSVLSNQSLFRTMCLLHSYVRAHHVFYDETYDLLSYLLNRFSGYCLLGQNTIIVTDNVFHVRKRLRPVVFTFSIIQQARSLKHWRAAGFSLDKLPQVIQSRLGNIYQCDVCCIKSFAGRLTFRVSMLQEFV